MDTNRGEAMLDRRQFLGRLAAVGVDAGLALALWDGLTGEARAARYGELALPWPAEYYEAGADRSVTCRLCPHHETLRPGETGLCRVRRNVRGKLVTDGSGQPCVMNVDPIEKNPLAHVLPGQKVLTIAHAGCNLRCAYCQNWQFSQRSPSQTVNLEFDQDQSLQLSRTRRLPAVTFTYTEGTSHIEFNKQFAAAARRLGLRAYLCTNGYIEPKPLADFLEVLDGATVTIKGFTDAFYRKVAGGSSVEPVLESCKAIKKAGKWIEAATLVVPGENDSTVELRRIAAWIARHLGAHTPWHIERFVPKYKLLDRPATPVKTLEKARNVGRAAGLKYVYISNLAPHPANHTYCHSCRKPVIKRLGFKVLSNKLSGGRCPYCRTPIPGVWT